MKKRQGRDGEMKNKRKKDEIEIDQRPEHLRYTNRTQRKQDDTNAKAKTNQPTTKLAIPIKKLFKKKMKRIRCKNGD